ncbi:hypothetical protein PSEUBRA_002763 [Kalmanozyma brasiliensis GHG001]|uniref:uncharacterized protein n=1 Tax=Kalmanozyma brasiliensis (strain GHG001) TaxID=1365824 RepID=UPI002867B2F0|nr:uncharacterized protein PSEUBRA_002763 [Kalmanozyma brasiliensis GHG001]KAF6767129.1 hypothetical protein PSEUBRA_002763 [Kalmanozyma brasiliensis GHG001]
MTLPTPLNLPSRPSTGLGEAVSHLQQEMKAYKEEIAQLTTDTEAAADRIALVLGRYRSQTQAVFAKSPHDTHDSELSVTALEQTFDAFHELQSLPRDKGHQTSGRQIVKPSFLNDTKLDTAENMAKSPLVPSSLTTIAAVQSSYEQSRTFLSVIAALKEEASRKRQCEIVEKRFTILLGQIAESTTPEACWLIAQQMVAYLRFVNLDRVRHSLHDQAQQVSQRCIAWWEGPSVFVERALTRYSLVHEVTNDPLFDGIVALVLIHFGVFDVEASKSVADDGSHSEIEGLTTLQKLARRVKLGSRFISPPVKDQSSISPSQALSIDVLAAFVELCSHGVLGSAILHDVLSLFALGDVDRDFALVESDMELLRTFLNKRLLPHTTFVRDTFGVHDPIRQIISMLKAMDKLKQANSPGTASHGNVPTRPLTQFDIEDSEWIPLERLPSSSVQKWPKQSRSQTLRWFARKRSHSQESDTFEAPKAVNMIDILNGYSPAHP